MNWYKKSQTTPFIDIDIRSYTQEINEVLSGLVEDPIDHNEFNAAKIKYLQVLSLFAQQLHANNIHDYDTILEESKNIDTKENSDIIFDQLWGMRQSIYSDPEKSSLFFSQSRELLSNFYILEKYLSGSYFSEEEKIDHLNQLESQTLNNMTIIKSLIEKMLSSSNQYRGTMFPLTIEATPSYDSSGNSISIETGTDSALLYVGDKQYYLYMSIYLNNNKIEILGDEVEDFSEIEEEFGPIISKIQPFYNFIRMLIKDPNRGQRKEKITTVYTARTTDSFKQFENSSRIPTNLFVSNSYNFVQGFAIDHKPRDIWKIRIGDTYLMTDETNNPNMVFQIYSPSGESSVPIKDIKFIERVE